MGSQQGAQRVAADVLATRRSEDCCNRGECFYPTVVLLAEAVVEQGAQSAKCADVRADADLIAEALRYAPARVGVGVDKRWLAADAFEAMLRLERAAAERDALVASLTRAEQRANTLLEEHGDYVVMMYDKLKAAEARAVRAATEAPEADRPEELAESATASSGRPSGDTSGPVVKKPCHRDDCWPGCDCP